MKYFSLLFVCMFSLNLSAQDCTSRLKGSWELSVMTERGERKSKVQITKSKNGWMGQGVMGTFDIALNGNTISWKNIRASSNETVEITSKGTCNSNGSITGVSAYQSGKQAGKKVDWIMKKKEYTLQAVE